MNIRLQSKQRLRTNLFGLRTPTANFGEKSFFCHSVASRPPHKGARITAESGFALLGTLFLGSALFLSATLAAMRLIARHKPNSQQKGRDPFLPLGYGGVGIACMSAFLSFGTSLPIPWPLALASIVFGFGLALGAVLGELLKTQNRPKKLKLHQLPTPSTTAVNSKIVYTIRPQKSLKDKTPGQASGSHARIVELRTDLGKRRPETIRPVQRAK